MAVLGAVGEEAGTTVELSAGGALVGEEDALWGQAGGEKLAAIGFGEVEVERVSVALEELRGVGEGGAEAGLDLLADRVATDADGGADGGG